MPAPVFVYGTLMRDRSNHGLLRGCRFLGRAAACGVGLYAVTPRFPGAVRKPESTVRLDELEDNGRLYRRELLPVVLEETGETLTAWVYLWLRGVRPEKAVPPEGQPWRP